MRKKVSFVMPLAFLCLLFCGPAGKVFAGTSDQLKQAAAYKDNRQYQQAEAIYQQIITSSPDTDDALEAQKQLALIYIATNRQQQADAAFEKLVADYSKHQGISEAVWQIARAYGQPEEHNKAFQLHQYNVEHFPGDVYTMRSQAEIVYSHLRKGDSAAANAAFDKLVTVFSSQPTLPKEIYQVAMKYGEAGRKDKAFQLHQYNVGRSSKDDMFTMWSQVEIIKSDIRDANEPAADAAFDKLLKVFSKQPTLPKEVYQLANTYSGAGKNDKAGQLYQYILKTWPGDKYAILAKDSLAAGAHLNDELSVKEAIDLLLADFSKNKDIAKALSGVLAKYYKAGSRLGGASRSLTYEKAAQLCQYVIDNWRDNDGAVINGNVELAKVRIAESNDVAVKAIMDELVAAYSSHPDLPDAVLRIAVEYDAKASRLENEGRDAEAKDNFENTLVVWKRIIEELPKLNSTVTAHAYYFSAECYLRLAQYSKAIEYYQKIVDNWPDYEYAWNAQYMIGRCYEILKNSGAVEKSVADAQVKAACEQVLEKYPDCPAANAARNLLNYHSTRK